MTFINPNTKQLDLLQLHRSAGNPAPRGWSSTDHHDGRSVRWTHPWPRAALASSELRLAFDDVVRPAAHGLLGPTQRALPGGRWRRERCFRARGASASAGVGGRQPPVNVAVALGMAVHQDGQEILAPGRIEAGDQRFVEGLILTLPEVGLGVRRVAFGLPSAGGSWPPARLPSARHRGGSTGAGLRSPA